MHHNRPVPPPRRGVAKAAYDKRMKRIHPVTTIGDNSVDISTAPETNRG